MYYEITDLEKIGCLEITHCKMIHNYIYKFTKNGNGYKLTHTVKELGEDVDYWTMSNKRFESFDDALDYIMDL